MCFDFEKKIRSNVWLGCSVLCGNMKNFKLCIFIYFLNRLSDSVDFIDAKKI